MLRARSAVQRFPVVEWRQRMEDFHRRSIVTSRHLAGERAWKESDCKVPVPYSITEVDDWLPERQTDSSRPEWASGSLQSRRSSNYGDSLHTPSLRHTSSHSGEGSLIGSSRFLSPTIISSRDSISPDHSDTESSYLQAQPSDTNQFRDIHDDEPYGDFLARANRQFSRGKRYISDPFMENSSSIPRPFGRHSRYSSVESIASIVEEKADSPLNKAITSVSISSGEKYAF